MSRINTSKHKPPYTAEELDRLVKLFQILIKIDKNNKLQPKNHLNSSVKNFS